MDLSQELLNQIGVIKPFNEKLPVMLKSSKKLLTSHEFILENVFITVSIGRLEAILEHLFSSPIHLEYQHGVLTFYVLRVRPDFYLPCSAVISSIQNKNHWFLGLGVKGEEYFDPESIIHAQIVGSSGSGKSMFMNYLITQTIANRPDIANLVVDLKGADFAHLKNQPGIIDVVSDTQKLRDYFQAILVEMTYRNYIFSERFVIPPSNLKEYNSLKEQYPEENLPHFPRVFIWIDEYYILSEFGGIETSEALNTIYTRARSCGIHLITSQSNTFVSSTQSNQISHRFVFPMSTDVANRLGVDLDRYPNIVKKIPSVPGKFILIAPLEISGTITAPHLTKEQGLYLGQYLKSPERPPFSFASVNIPPEKLQNFSIMKDIIRGRSYQSIHEMINPLEVKPPEDLKKLEEQIKPISNKNSSNL